MVEFCVLQCPVCEKSRVCPSDQFDDRGEIKRRATEHLRTHRLNESERGIFRVMMAEKCVQIEAEDSDELSVGKWLTSPDIAPSR